MDVTVESEEQAGERLRLVFAGAEVRWLAGEYAFEEFQNINDAGAQLGQALALVRDEDRWSLLRAAEANDAERFCVFSCHFDPDILNSGFVGWLASALKRSLGTGVFVICGHNRERGGIFDYWGLPVEVRAQAEQLLETGFSS